MWNCGGEQCVTDEVEWQLRSRRYVIVAPAVHVRLDRVLVRQFVVDLLIHQTIVYSIVTALHELDT